MVKVVQVLKFDHYYHVECLLLVLLKQAIHLVDARDSVSELKRALYDILKDSVDCLLQSQLKQLVRVVTALIDIHLLVKALRAISAVDVRVR